MQTAACWHNAFFWRMGVFTCFWAKNGHLRTWWPFFLVFTCFWAEKWTPADMMTLKKSVLLLRSENMVTLGTRVVRSCFIEAVLHQFQANCVRICNFLPEQCYASIAVCLFYPLYSQNQCGDFSNDQIFAKSGELIFLLVCHDKTQKCSFNSLGFILFWLGTLQHIIRCGFSTKSSINHKLKPKFRKVALLLQLNSPIYDWTRICFRSKRIYKIPNNFEFIL